MDLIKVAEEAFATGKKFPEFKAGDTVTVAYKIMTASRLTRSVRCAVPSCITFASLPVRKPVSPRRRSSRRKRTNLCRPLYAKAAKARRAFAAFAFVFRLRGGLRLSFAFRLSAV